MSKIAFTVVALGVIAIALPILSGCESHTAPTQKPTSPVHENRTLIWWQSPGVKGGATTFAKPDPAPLVITDRTTTFETETNALTVSYRLVDVDENTDVYKFDLILNGAGPTQRTIRYSGGSMTIYEDKTTGASLTIEPPNRT